jgi:predicted transcriptional regulator
VTGPGQPESTRVRKSVGIRLSPEARERLSQLAGAWGVSRSAAAERVILSTHIVSLPKGSR